MIKVADIHTHINFGVDDGSQSLEESIKMMDALYEEGVRIAFATHHYGARNEKLDPKVARRRVEILHDIAKDRYDSFLIMPGCEIYYRPGIIEELKSGRALGLADSRYVLIEFKPDAGVDRVLHGVKDCVLNGYRPIVAHVDKINDFRSKPEIVQDIIDTGGYVQINAQCLTQGERTSEYVWAREQILTGQVHFVASDCHRLEWRPPIMQQEAQKLVQLIGKKNALKILVRNPISIIKNEVI